MDLTESFREVRSVVSDWYYVARTDIWKADIPDYDKISIASELGCLQKKMILDYNGYKFFKFKLKEFEKSYHFNWGRYLI